MDLTEDGNVSTAKESTAQAIKAKTDNLPASPASQVQTLQIPLLTWDARSNSPPYFAYVGTWTQAKDTAVSPTKLGSVLFNTAQNDEIRISCNFLDMSARVLHIRAHQDADRGIISVYLNEVLQGTVDFYSLAGARGEVEKTLAVTPTQIGKNTLTFRIATKNPASVNYLVYLMEMWIL